MVVIESDVGSRAWNSDFIAIIISIIIIIIVIITITNF